MAEAYTYHPLYPGVRQEWGPWKVTESFAVTARRSDSTEDLSMCPGLAKIAEKIGSRFMPQSGWTVKRMKRQSQLLNEYKSIWIDQMGRSWDLSLCSPHSNFSPRQDIKNGLGPLWGYLGIAAIAGALIWISRKV